jgi:hypothetical protein
MFFVKGHKFSVSSANQAVKKLGYQDTSEVDELEVRVKKNGSKFNLIIKQDGIEKEIGNSAAEILNLISPIDADSLQGMKIQTGTVSTKSTGVIVFFSEAFQTEPVVLCTCNDNYYAWRRYTTTTSVYIYCSATVNKNTGWVAIGA